MLHGGKRLSFLKEGFEGHINNKNNKNNNNEKLRFTTSSVPSSRETDTSDGPCNAHGGGRSSTYSDAVRSGCSKTSVGSGWSKDDNSVNRPSLTEEASPSFTEPETEFPGVHQPQQTASSQVIAIRNNDCGKKNHRLRENAEISCLFPHGSTTDASDKLTNKKSNSSCSNSYVTYTDEGNRKEAHQSVHTTKDSKGNLIHDPIGTYKCYNVNKNYLHVSFYNWFQRGGVGCVDQSQQQQQHRQQELLNEEIPEAQCPVKNRIETPPSNVPLSSGPSRPARDQSSIWVTRTSGLEAVANPEESHDEEWAERVSLSDTSDYHHQEPVRNSARVGSDPARTGLAKPSKVNVRSRRTISRPGRRRCCKILHLKEDNARFILLAVVLVLYMLSGAALFAALERNNELKEKELYRKHIDSFKSKYPLVNESDLRLLLDIHSQAESAGFVGNKRPRWDFSGAFYFVGTVVSTIGE